MTGRSAPTHQLEPVEARKIGWQQATLDRGRQLDLPLQPLLLERLSMKIGVLQRDGGLVGKHRQCPPVRRSERPHAVAALFVGDHQQSPALAVGFDRHGEQV
jgi:hypothetical protein